MLNPSDLGAFLSDSKVSTAKSKSIADILIDVMFPHTGNLERTLPLDARSSESAHVFNLVEDDATCLLHHKYGPSVF